MNPARLNALIRKECYQIIRDPSSILIALVLLILLIFIFTYAVSLDINHLRLGVVIEEQTAPARELAGEWAHPYTREQAAFPLRWIGESKFFPYVSKIDNGYGDRNLCCRNCE